MKSALFVDFDNVYSGLRKLDPAMADRFAQKPQRWMQWLMSALALPEYAPREARRRVLVRRCYLNPQAYQRFRPAFNLAGFEIVDCPALTSEGKTSTDIHMVLDMIDLLQHEAHYDEFIVFSADADFTPVLRRLRRWDRRTTVLAIGFPSAAYRASADMLIDQDEFIRSALGFRDDEEPSAPEPAAPAIRKSDGALAQSAFSLIGKLIAESANAIPVARLAQAVLNNVEGMDTASWAGFGSFRKLLEAAPTERYAVCWDAGGFVFDPKRHKIPAGPTETAVYTVSDNSGMAAPTRNGQAANDWGEASPLSAIAAQIHDVTGAPLLTPASYGQLFRQIAEDLAEYPFELNETGKRVRDRMRATGSPVSRADVTWVLRGLLFRGHVFGTGKDDAASLATKSADNLRSLCLREQMVIDTATDAAINRWIAADANKAPTEARMVG